MLISTFEEQFFNLVLKYFCFLISLINYLMIILWVKLWLY